jgi:hypothetical protein
MGELRVLPAPGRPGPQGGQEAACRTPPPSSQENDQKRIRALKKANKERDLKKQRLRELAKAKQEMVALRLEHQRLSVKLQKYSIFKKYLEKVVENSEVDPSGRGQGAGRGNPGLFLSTPFSPQLGGAWRLLGPPEALQGWSLCFEEMWQSWRAASQGPSVAGCVSQRVGTCWYIFVCLCA